MATRRKKARGADPRAEELLGLGRRVKRWRVEASLTQKELAGKLGISVPYVSLIERGARNPPFTLVLAIARAVKVSPVMLVE